MTTIELETWEKIVDDPRAEVKALFKRKELRFADFHDDPLSWHMQATLWNILRELDDAFSRYEYDQKEPGGSDYSRWAALANRTFSLGLLRAIREHADEMTAVLEARKSRDQMLRDQIARQIRAELVCDCASNAKSKSTWDAEGNWDYEAYQKIRTSPDYHLTCDTAESAAQIAEGESGVLC